MKNTKATKIITISGKARSGKDQSAKFIKTELENKGYKVLVAHYADLLKYICKTFLDWNGEKDEFGRTLLQYVGTDVVRKNNPNYWVQFIIDVLKMFPNEWDYVIIPDTRFANEINCMEDNFNVTTIKILRPESSSELTEEQKNHISETELDEYRFDYMILNDTTVSNLRSACRNIVKDITRLKTIYIDLDCTTINTIKAITELYDEDYKYYSDYEKIPWYKVKTWDFLELKAAKPEHINLYFNQQRFFDKVDFFPWARDTIAELNEKYNIVFVSHGYSPNLRAKEKFVNTHFPYAKFIGVNLKEHEDKSCVDMSDGIFIDDGSKNLYNSNAKIKICFGDRYEWNFDFVQNQKDTFHAPNWKGVRDILCQI